MSALSKNEKQALDELFIALTHKDSIYKKIVNQYKNLFIYLKYLFKK